MRLSVLSRVKRAMRSHSAAFSRYSLSLFMAKPLSPSLSCFIRSPSQWLLRSQGFHRRQSRSAAQESEGRTWLRSTQTGVQIAPLRALASFKAAGAYGTKNLQRFTMPWEVIASAEGLLGISKVGGSFEILNSAREEAPFSAVFD